jgi:hypothetical protein
METNHLAEGEHTGHYHAASGPDVQLWQWRDAIILEAPSGADIVHQEHRAFRVRPGVYDREIVREFDHFAEEARLVVD